MPPKAGGPRGAKVGGSRPLTAARDDVVPLTAHLFAMGTKNSHHTAEQQEQLLHDRLVLIRHGERQDHVDRAWKGNSLLPVHDPPLSNTGRKQSFETALKYAALQQGKRVEQRIQGTFSAILVSPFHRCLETALILNLVAFGGALAIFVEPQLSDWQQQRVFRAAPSLAGRYALQAQAGTNAHRPGSCSLVFQPQLEALRAALEPFFQARAAELAELAETYKVNADAAAAWLTNLEVWLAHHASLPVWTSEAIEAAVTAQLGRSAEKAPVRQAGQCKTGGEAGDGYAGCGVPHPEGKADLLRRCQQVEQTHFLFSGSAARQVPPRVRRAVAAEQRDRLPKYFQTLDARPAASRAVAGPAALLPPLHLMAVTHADVIAGMVDVCCPKHLGDASGKSVPYCSVTVLVRHNNYYRIPPVAERVPVAAGGRGTANGGGHGGRGKAKRGGGRGVSQAANVPLPARGGGAAAAEALPVDWQVEVVGCTDLLLTTRVLLQFS